MAWGGPTLIGSGSGTTSALTQTITGITASIGDLVVVSGAAFTATVAASITLADSAGNTWTACVRTKTNSGNINCWIFFSVLTNALAGGTITVTGTNNLINWRMAAAAFTGQAASPEDTACRASLNDGGTAAPTVTSGVPTVSGDLMIGAVAGSNGSANTFTEASGWTNIVNGSTPNVSPHGFSYKINAGSAAQTYNPTLGTVVNTTTLITAFKVGGAAAISGSVAITEVQDAIAATGTTVIDGAVALQEVQDSLAATGSVLISGAVALVEVQDSIAATGTLTTAISGSVALQEVQDSLAATGTVTLAAINGSVALQEIQDSIAGQGNNGIVILLDGHDPGLKKRRRKQEARRQQELAEDQRRRERQREQIAEAFERIVEGKEISAPVAHEVTQEAIRAIERSPLPDTGDFAARLDAAVEHAYRAYLERDDEEVLALL